MDLTFTLPLALLALTIEAAVGYPLGLLRRIGHPVVWFGAVIDFLDRHLNSERDDMEKRRRNGVIALIILLVPVIFLTAFVTRLVGQTLLGLLVLSIVAASLPAQRSLASHVRAVADGLDVNVDAGREAVSHVVGRDVASLDEAGVARAAIESLAENFSDGIAAPVFWIALFGLPGGAVYKAINTADSMIGHRTPRYEAFGWASARLDDVVNWPASRIAAGLIIAAAYVMRGADANAARRAVARDPNKHASPNAGWPEAAMAGALGLQLGGRRIYDGVLVDDAFMGDGRRDPDTGDIRRALSLYRRALILQWIAVLGLTILAALIAID
ncbi:MAG: cobalamin biosynthesis protein CobD [Methylobacteriaceae bacterium]|nr:cobalamin biosynthesis protein CobD [Methylobacteriaceae bacterium]MBV9394099.1 cobalamin biosynthesis protein CobD [Methylobacteriaceae bacterium]